MIELEFTRDQLSVVGGLLLKIKEVSPSAFDGPRHRDICIDQANGLWSRMKNRWNPEVNSYKMKLSVADRQIIHIAVSQLPMTSTMQHEGSRVIMKVQPTLLHS